MADIAERTYLLVAGAAEHSHSVKERVFRNSSVEEEARHTDLLAVHYRHREEAEEGCHTMESRRRLMEG